MGRAAEPAARVAARAEGALMSPRDETGQFVRRAFVGPAPDPSLRLALTAAQRAVDLLAVAMAAESPYVRDVSRRRGLAALDEAAAQLRLRLLDSGAAALEAAERGADAEARTAAMVASLRWVLTALEERCDESGETTCAECLVRSECGVARGFLTALPPDPAAVAAWLRSRDWQCIAPGETAAAPDPAACDNCQHRETCHQRGLGRTSLCGYKAAPSPLAPCETGDCVIGSVAACASCPVPEAAEACLGEEAAATFQGEAARVPRHGEDGGPCDACDFIPVVCADDVPDCPHRSET